jgi:hypothetical protein
MLNFGDGISAEMRIIKSEAWNTCINTHFSMKSAFSLKL